MLIAFISCEEEPTSPLGQTNKLEFESIVANSVSYRSANIYCKISHLNQNNPDLFGLIYSTSGNPDISDQLITAETDTVVNISLETLDPGTDYYYKLFLKYGDKYFFSEIFQFTTPELGTPVVSTSLVTSITASTAISGGEISEDGGEPVTAGGVCWSTSQNPTILDSYTEDASGIGSYTSTITGLSPGIIYYLRAYATNSIGTAYGNEYSFQTEDGLAQVSTSPVSGITENSAATGGIVSSDGGFPVTERGVCWSTNENPTISDNHTVDGAGLDSYTSQITGLNSFTKYFVRAYATNAVATSYGDQVSFATICPQTITDYDGNTYSSVAIGEQCWMNKNMRVTHYPDGTSIPWVLSESQWIDLEDNNTDDAYCYYDNETTNASVYGALYSWAAATGDNSSGSNANPSGVQGICPDGWHLPSRSEWEQLYNYLTNNGYDGNEANALKSTSGWDSGGNGTDNFGFNAKPSGMREEEYGNFSLLGHSAYIWTSTDDGGVAATAVRVSYNYFDIVFLTPNMSYGFAVRCVMD